MYLKWLLYYVYEVIWLFTTVYTGIMYFLIPQGIYQQFPDLHVIIAIIFLCTLVVTLTVTWTDSRGKIFIIKNDKF